MSIANAANNLMSHKDRMWRETLKGRSVPFDAKAFDIDEATMQAIINSANIKSPEQLNNLRFNSFARYGVLDIAHNHSGSREYLFFTKPDLHIFSTNGFEINKQLKDVTGAIHNAKKVITCLIKKFSPKDQVLRQYPAPTNPLTDEMRKINKVVMGV